MLVTRNKSYGINRDWVRVRWRCVLEVFPRLIWSQSHAHSTFGISVEPKYYLAFALSMNMIISCLLQNDYSFKLENNGYSVYMNNTFTGHALDKHGLVNLDHSNTLIYNIYAKRCKLVMISTTCLWHCREGHTGVKRMKKLHADGSFWLTRFWIGWDMRTMPLGQDD